MTLPTAKEITSLYLYGSETTPSNKVDDALVRAGAVTSNKDIDTAEFMSTGGGRFALAAQFEMVQKFFETTLGSYTHSLAAGTYSKADLLTEFSMAQADWDMHQYDYRDGTDDYFERTYIYNSMSFMMDNVVEFVVDGNGTRHIENLKIIPRPVGDGFPGENFDMDGGGWVTDILDDVFLEPFVDPSGIGRKVNITFTGGVSEIDGYTAGHYATEGYMIGGWDGASPTALAEGLDSFIENSWDDGTIKFLDGDKPILYGTTGNDAIAASDIGFTTHPTLESYEENGVVFVAGHGNDTMEAGDGEDIFYFEFENNADDVITDFEIGEDKIDLSDIQSFGPLFRPNIEAAATESGGDVTLHINGHDIIVEDVTKTNLFDNDPFDSFIGLIGGTAGMSVEGTSSGEYIQWTGSGYTDGQGDHATANNDTITGGLGNDVLFGGAGNDLYVWNIGDGSDYIVENESETNVVRMVGVTSDTLYLFSENSYYYRIMARYSANGGTTVSGQVTVEGQNGGTANTELRYLQLDDRTFDTHEGMLYRAVDTAYGERIDASPLYNANDTMYGSASDPDTLYGYGGNDSISGKMPEAAQVERLHVAANDNFVLVQLVA